MWDVHVSLILVSIFILLLLSSRMYFLGLNEKAPRVGAQDRNIDIVACTVDPCLHSI